VGAPVNSVAAPLPQRRHGHRAVLGALALLLATVATWSLTRGAMAITPGDVAGALSRWLSGAAAQGDDNVVLALRLPRLLLAVMVGAALATGGSTMQGLFRNPLADPGLIGVSAGAALGAVGSTALVFAIGRRRAGVASLLLAGVAINAIAMAGVGLLTYLANENQLRDLTFWSLGSLGGASWSRLAIVAPWIMLPLLFLPRAARALNALLLGEGEAALLGYRPERLQPLLVGLVALSVGASVAFTGVIGFVGLVVPHLLRMGFGPDHRFLLPASALGGAILLVAADALARTIVAPGELPIGVLTALVGGPFFLWLLLGRRAGETVS
jgi:iron complex transport system permease protein